MRRVARGLTPSQQLPPSPEPNGVLAMVSVLYGEEYTPVKYIEGARRLASELPPPWALWVAATAGVQRSVAFQRLLASAPNVHIVRVDGKAEVKNARRQSCSFDATLLRFLLLDDPRLAVGVVVDLDIDDGKKAAQRFVSLAIWAMHTGKRWCVHQYPCHPRPRGGARVVPVGASGTPGPSCRFVERRRCTRLSAGVRRSLHTWRTRERLRAEGCMAPTRRSCEADTARWFVMASTVCRRTRMSRCSRRRTSAAVSCLPRRRSHGHAASS